MISSMHRPLALLLLAIQLLARPSQALRPPKAIAVSGAKTKPKHTNQDPLKTIAFAASQKKPRSTRYLADWRRYSKSAIESIRQHVADNLPHPVDPDATDRLTYALGHAADQGRMPSFSDPGARAGYTLGLFGRARLIADLVFLDTVEPPFSGDTSDPHLLATTDSNNKGPCCSVMSIGGGPGYDFVGAALVASFHTECTAYASRSGWHQNQEFRDTNSDYAAPQTNLTIRATVYDYEPGWSDLAAAVTGATRAILGNDYDCRFGGRCDITLPLTASTNTDLMAQASTTNVFVCQYCVAENAARLRESDYAFFRQLFRLAPQGALFLFSETTHRPWPEIIDLVASAHGFEVSFPFPKRGRNGVCLVVRKKQGARVSEQHLEKCKRYARHQELNDRRQQKGFVRQQRKVRKAEDIDSTPQYVPLITK